jgi:hypothetical protein
VSAIFGDSTMRQVLESARVETRGVKAPAGSQVVAGSNPLSPTGFRAAQKRFGKVRAALVSLPGHAMHRLVQHDRMNELRKADPRHWLAERCIRVME